MARTRLTNPRPLVEFQYNPYQSAFLMARRLRGCPNTCVFTDRDPCEPGDVGKTFTWSMLDSLVCPKCGGPGRRVWRRFYLRAGRRGGKTRVGALSAVEEATVPNSIGWACAPTFAELEDYLIPTFFSILPAEWFDHPNTEWSEDRYDLRLPNGAEVHFRSLDDPNRVTGPGLDWLWIDEARKVQPLAWQIARPALVDKKGIAFLTSSPDWGEDWCHQSFWKPASEGKPGYWAVQYRTIDNPTIDPAEIEADRATMPPEFFRREYEASVEFPTGTIYGSVLPQAEATDDRIREWIPEWPQIDPSRPAIVGLDPGTDHPFAGVLIVVTPRGLVWAREYAKRNLRYRVHALGSPETGPGLKETLTLNGVLTPRWGIDKSQAQAALELSQPDIGIFAQGAPNDVNAGIQRMYAWLGSGKMLISKTYCPQSIKTMRVYRWADLKPNAHGLPDDVQPYKVDDDIPDAGRYAVMLWPELPTAGPEARLATGGRDLTLLPPAVQALLKRNGSEDDADGDLVRVTDSFDQQFDDSVPSAGGFGEFYESGPSSR